jgi:hypothetical protein
VWQENSSSINEVSQSLFRKRKDISGLELASTGHGWVNLADDLAKIYQF